MNLIMAKFTAGVGFGTASGSIASTTYSRNRYGAYIRNRAIPVNPNTAVQTSVRSRFGAQSAAWRALTAGQREQWNTQAPLISLVDSLGSTYTPSGAQFYSSVNLNRSICGQSALSAPPIVDTPPAIASASLAVSGTTPAFDLTFSAAIAAGDFLIVQATAPSSAGRSYFGRSEYKQIAVLDSTDTSPADLQADYEAVFGALDTGDVGAKVSVRLVPVSANGFAQAHFRADAIIS